MNSSRTDKENPADSSGIGSVGRWLRASREDQGLNLDAVAGVTRIGKSYLEAIEEGDLSKLPSLAYTRGFIRLYASHLGLPPEKALAMLGSSPAAPAESAPEIQTRRDDRGRARHVLRRGPLLTAVAALLLAAGYILFKPAKNAPDPLRSSLPVTVPQNTAALPAANPDGLKTAPLTGQPQPELQQKSADSQGIVLRLRAVSDGRIHITIDGSVSQEYDLVSGDLVEWKAENQFMLDLDNAASVEGELGGVKLKPFGEPGRAAHLVLKADGVHTE